MIQGISLGLYEKAMPDSLSLREKLRLAKKAGVDYLEISIDETDQKLARLEWTEQDVRGVLEICREEGIPIRSVCLSGHRKYPLGSRNEAVRARSLEIMRGAIRVAALLGVRVIQLAGYDVYYEQGGADTEALFSENLRKSALYAAQAGVILAFETMETPFMNTVEKAMRYVRAVNSPYLQVYPDIGNVTNGAANAVEDLKSGAGHIVAAHLKETVPGVFRDMEYGQGRVDFPSCIRALYDMGVRMCVCEFWYDKKTEPYEYLERNMKYIRNAIERGTL